MVACSRFMDHPDAAAHGAVFPFHYGHVLLQGHHVVRVPHHGEHRNARVGERRQPVDGAQLSAQDFLFCSAVNVQQAEPVFRGSCSLPPAAGQLATSQTGASA